MNNNDLHEQWRRVMREAKASELKRDAQAMAEAHRRLVDHKDTTLRKVTRNLDDAEEQHRMALRSHSTLVDRLMDLQRERVRSLEQEFGSSLQRMQREFDQEREQIKSSHERQKEELERLMSAMSDAFNEQLSNARSEFESTREEIKNRNSEEYNVLKHSLEQVIDDLEKQFEQAHQAYRASTDAKMQSFRQLTKSDQKSADTIAARM
jgi:HD-GYP domain-containing protein (c-di-GMP phosphodiesterase class II)